MTRNRGGDSRAPAACEDPATPTFGRTRAQKPIQTPPRRRTPAVRSPPAPRSHGPRPPPTERAGEDGPGQPASPPPGRFPSDLGWWHLLATQVSTQTAPLREGTRVPAANSPLRHGLVSAPCRQVFGGSRSPQALCACLLSDYRNDGTPSDAEGLRACPKHGQSRPAATPAGRIRSPAPAGPPRPRLSPPHCSPGRRARSCGWGHRAGGPPNPSPPVRPVPEDLRCGSCSRSPGRSRGAGAGFWGPGRCSGSSPEGRGTVRQHFCRFLPPAPPASRPPPPWQGCI